MDQSIERIPEDDMSLAKSSKDKRFQYDNVIKRKNRTLLTDKSTRRVPGSAMGGSQILEKIPESSFKKKAGDTTKGDAEQTGKKDPFANLSPEELAFTMDYRKLEDLEREKGIKFFECVGDPPMTEEFAENIDTNRQDFITKRENQMREKDCFRFSTEVNNDKVVVPTNN